MGYRYFAVVEDYFTGFNLHCEGWNSVYLNPSRPCFLGSSPMSLGDTLVQNTRWFLGLGQVALSKYSPLVYGALRMSVLQSMVYAELAFYAIYFLPVYILALVPQLCLLAGIPLYPEVRCKFIIRKLGMSKYEENVILTFNLLFCLRNFCHKKMLIFQLICVLNLLTFTKELCFTMCFNILTARFTMCFNILTARLVVRPVQLIKL